MAVHWETRMFIGIRIHEILPLRMLKNCLGCSCSKGLSVLFVVCPYICMFEDTTIPLKSYLILTLSGMVRGHLLMLRTFKVIK